MKSVLTILFCFCSLLSMAQARKYKGVVKQTADAYQFKTIISDSAIGLPRYNRKLDTAEIKYMGREKDAFMFYDTLHGFIYTYNPHTGTVDTVNRAGSGGIVAYTPSNAFEDAFTGATNSYNIGKTPVAGTVNVFVNGVKLPKESYSVNGNNVLVNTAALSFTLSNADRIDINYQSFFSTQ